MNAADIMKPDESECCGSGCTPCIFDIYDQQLKKLKQQNCKTENQNSCMSLMSYTIFIIINIEKDSDNTFLYTFKYLRRNKKCETESGKNFNISYYAGQHFLLRGEANLESRYFTRAYTPIKTTNFGNDTFTILIKFYEQGLMSNYLQNLNINSETYWRGPYGDYKINYKLKNLLMICQGTGVAPFFSIINDIVINEDCYTFIKLFYCCKNAQNIHLRNEIYKLSSYWNFTYEIFLSRTNMDFDKKYNEIIHSNRLKLNDFIKYFENKIDNFQVLVCGSELFSNQIIKFLTNADVSNEFIYVF